MTCRIRIGSITHYDDVTVAPPALVEMIVLGCRGLCFSNLGQVRGGNRSSSSSL